MKDELVIVVGRKFNELFTIYKEIRSLAPVTKAEKLPTGTHLFIIDEAFIKLTPTPVIGFDFAAKGTESFTQLMVKNYVEKSIWRMRDDQVKKMRQNPGVRNRWGQVK